MSNGSASSSTKPSAPQPVDQAVDRTALGNVSAVPSSEASAPVKSDNAAVSKTSGDEGMPKGFNRSDTATTDAATADVQSGTAKSPAVVKALAATVTPAANLPAVSDIPKASIPQIASNGSFTQDIDVDVPAFHGLEPKISLHYDSARKSRVDGLYQGWVGYGWGLERFDVIERGQPGYGVPNWANDVMYLNGEPLVVCATSGPSPSCSTGGNYAKQSLAYSELHQAPQRSQRARWKVFLHGSMTYIVH